MCLYHSYLKTAEALTDAEFGRLVRAALVYSETGTAPALGGNERVLFPVIKWQIDKDVAYFQESHERRRSAGKKGGESNAKQKEALPSNAKQSQASASNSSNDNANANDIYTTTAAASACAREGEPFADSLHDDDLAACIVCYEENIGSIPRYVSEAMAGWLRKLPAELICKAIAEAAAANVRNWKYAESILKRCEASNITSVAAYEAESVNKGPAKASEGNGRLCQKRARNCVRLREVRLVEINEAAELLDGMLNYWPGMLRGNDPEGMAKAWACSLADVPLNAAKKATADLSRTKTFPPSVKELAEAAQPYMVRRQNWDEKWSIDCHECLGWDTPLYKVMQAEKAKVAN